MKLLGQRLIAWWAFLHAIMLLTLPFSILFSSKDGVLGKEPGLLDRGLFLYGDLLSLLPGPEPFWFFTMPPILWAVLWLLSGRLIILPWRLSAPYEGEN